jgi:O-antigen/teichoic acid export membrane protein
LLIASSHISCIFAGNHQLTGMSTIRRQSIISSIVVYIGFVLGFLNTYLFAREGGFTASEYGLTSIFVAIANVMFSFANLGMPTFIYKFFPYYRDNMKPSENDMPALSLTTGFVGFIMVLIAGIIFKDFVIKKYDTNSPQLIQYYYWLFPFGFGLTFYSLLEAFAWHFRKTLLTNFLREMLFRLLTTVLIILSFVGVIKDFDLFIKLYAFTYIAIALVLLGYLVKTGKIHFTFSISRVTRKFRHKILAIIAFVWGGSIVYNISQVFDSIIIGSVLKDGLAFVAIYTLAQNIASLVQAPQRAIIASSVPTLSEAWRQKDYGRINRIYHSSSINQLLFAAGMFVLIWLNFTDGVLTFHLKKDYLSAQDVFLYIGLMRVIDLGTGLNSQIIATSTHWRFDFITGVILMCITLPFNYMLTKSMGVSGPAISNLIAFSIYNLIRYLFLWKKFNMQPFTYKSLYVLILASAGYLICHVLFSQYQGFGWIVLRSTIFLGIYVTGALLLKISPDILPVWETVKSKIRRKKQ